MFEHLGLGNSAEKGGLRTEFCTTRPVRHRRAGLPVTPRGWEVSSLSTVFSRNLTNDAEEVRLTANRRERGATPAAVPPCYEVQRLNRNSREHANPIPLEQHIGCST